MDNQEIPLLTEVYATKPSTPSAKEKVQVSDAQITPQMVNEIVSEFRPALTQEITQALTKNLTLELTDKISAQLTKELTTNLRKEFTDELKKMQASIDSIEKVATGKTSINQKTIEQDLIQKNASLLENSKKELSIALDRMGKENAERVTLDIASKITGMQELAVSQVKSQVLNNLSSMEEGFKNAVNAISEGSQKQVKLHVKEHLDKQTNEFTKTVSQTQTQLNEEVAKMNAQVVASLQQQASDFTKAVLDGQRQSLLEELNTHYQAELKKSKEAFNKTAQSVSNELLQVVTAYSAKLTEESHAQLQINQQTVLTQASEQIKTQISADLVAVADDKMAGFKVALDDIRKTLDSDLPEVEKKLTDKVNKILDKEIPKIEEKLMKKIKEEINATLQGIKLVLPK